MLKTEKDSDLWETPSWLFNALDSKFKFTLDVCANAENAKCKQILSDALNGDWLPLSVPGTAFMNPPYSNPYPFVCKAMEQSKKGWTIVCLLKCDTSTKLWELIWDYTLQQPKYGVEINYLPKRLKFERNGIPSKTAANFPSVIVILRGK